MTILDCQIRIRPKADSRLTSGQWAFLHCIFSFQEPPREGSKRHLKQSGDKGYNPYDFERTTSVKEQLIILSTLWIWMFGQRFDVSFVFRFVNFNDFDGEPYMSTHAGVRSRYGGFRYHRVVNIERTVWYCARDKIIDFETSWVIRAMYNKLSACLSNS